MSEGRLWEELILEAPGALEGAPSPGLVQRALAEGAGIRADEVGIASPTGRGRVLVEVAAARARRIATPRHLVLQDATMVLRRADDPPEEAHLHLEFTWTDCGPPPPPGALAVALSEATGGWLGAEHLGYGISGPGWLRLTAPDRLLIAERLPERFQVGRRTLTLEPLGAVG